MTTTAEVSKVEGQASRPDNVVPVRRTAFETALDSVPKYFCADGNVIESHVNVVLSTMFPDGEEFFIRSVRHFRSEITDPALRKQVAGFIGQESVHGREHRLVNDRFDELGYRAKAMERFVNFRIRLAWKLLNPKLRLAGTAAVEHFTACLAESILADEAVQARFGETVIADLFRWHALEELEHKSVTFDVYRAVGGSEKMRIGAMKVVRFFFFAGLAAMTAISIATDREARRSKRLRRDWATFRAGPLMSREFMAMLKEYDRPGFHPDDRDTDALLESAREQYFGDNGSLVQFLAS